ncbi:Crp/Fnr family transcriptional regulator [Labrys okinawensis]|uniref:Crp/Fnr family transcriptional regulator n=1 Tax=Labrys okinawensis TaxID=346911 RepID=UPI0039BD11F5
MSPPIEDELMQNRLLAQLRDDDRARLLPHFFKFDLKANDVLQKAGEDVQHTWFPCASSMAAFSIWVDDDGHGVEVGLIGSEGAVGGIVSNGHVPAYATALVRAPGKFLRIKTTALEQAKLDSIALRHWFSRYSDCLLAQIFQTAACNATHTISQRTAKWLLAAVARTKGNQIEMTQEQLAQLLGVGRTFVTRVVQGLRSEGLVSTRRGVFIIEDEDALRLRSCACTSQIEDHFDTVLHGIYPID